MENSKRIEKATGVDMPSYGGVVANSYLPSNWLSALGLYAGSGGRIQRCEIAD